MERLAVIPRLHRTFPPTRRVAAVRILILSGRREKTKVQVHDAPLAGARAQGILKPLLLRRTKDSKLEGKPLLTLPPKTVELVTLKFSPEEREVRRSVPELLDSWADAIRSP